MKTTRHLTLILLLHLFVNGCGMGGAPGRPEGVAVSGKVLLPNGSPLTGGTLILRPESGLFGATALIQSDGSFSLRDTAGNENAVEGRYQVFVSFPNPNHAALAAKVSRRYQESDDYDSDVVVDIQGPTDQMVIRLKK